MQYRWRRLGMRLNKEEGKKGEKGEKKKEGKEMFYLTMHSTHFIYSYMASDIW